MRRVLIGLLVSCVLPAAAQAQVPQLPPVDAGATCGQLSPTAATCTGGQKLADAAAAECRRLGLPDADCALPLAHDVSTQIVTRYRKTWLHRTAAFQYRLGNPLPLLSAQWLGTHNSFNSVNGTATPSHTDSNQQLSLRQQLDVDMRALELDVHFVPSAAAGGANAVVVCHGRGPDEAHFGCTNEPLFSQVLPEIRGWLDAHPHQVVLLYLEDELGDAAGYASTVGTLDSVMKRKDGSSLIYRPSASEMTAKGCANLPLGISRDDVRARRARVVLVGNCRSGWASDVYGWDDVHVESGSTPDYKPFPTCDSTYPRSVYDAKLVRYYEDSTFVATATDPTETPAQQQDRSLTPARVGDMTRCGVNLFGFDQILPNDGRIDASIWSWAKDEPRRGAGRCALQRADGRWATRPCATRRLAACRTTTGWTLTQRAVSQPGAGAACSRLGATFGIPRTGYENSQLRQVAGRHGVWLNYRLG